MDVMNERHWPDLRPVGLVALAIAAVWSTAIATRTWKNVRTKPDGRTLRVTGSAKKRIVSDLIAWEATLEAHAPDRTSAYKQLHEQVDKTVEFLKAQGIKPEEIRPSSATFEEEYDVKEQVKVLQGTNVPTTTEQKTFKGFVTRESIEIRSSDVARIEKASREVTSLLEEGVAISSEAPRYYYTKLGELKIEMLAAAAADARERAEKVVGSAGGAELGKLVSADMGIININPANSTQTSEEGNNDTTSLDKDIITIVHTVYDLE
jgi:hypothetical protein